MTYPMIIPTVAVLLVAFTSQAQQSPSPQSAQAAPCGAAAPASKPTLRVPSKFKSLVDKYSPISGEDLTKPASSVKSGSPCPPPTSNTQPAAKLPPGGITTWLCNPVVTSTDASHTATLITPDELTVAEPLLSSMFEADGAKADLKAATSCANLRRDPKNNRVFLAQ
jgi:hypothetical protein